MSPNLSSLSSQWPANSDGEKKAHRLSYSFCYAAWVLMAWGIFGAMMVSAIRESVLALVGWFLGSEVEIWFPGLLELVFIGMLGLAFLIHLAVWLVPPLRRRVRPHWRTHGVALLTIALPGLLIVLVLFYDPGPPQLTAPVARQRILPMEKEFTRQLYPPGEATSLRETNSFSTTPFELSLPPPKALHLPEQ